MKRFLHKIAIISVSALLCGTGALYGCGETVEEPPYSPEIEYTIDETVLESKINANDTQFSVKEVTQVEESPLYGKTFYWLGSSVTYGASSQGESMADFLAAKTGAVCKKEAVSGTTIFDDGGNGDTGLRSYTRRLKTGKVFDVTEEVDAFICQISTNDARNDRLTKWGTITGEDVTETSEFDLKTTLGGVEFIISYVFETWGCPVYFYSGGWFGDSGARSSSNPTGTNYGKLVDEVKKVVEKWQNLGYDVGVIDLFNDEDFNAQASEDYYKWCMNDAIHPRRAGYLNWWMPYFEQYLLVALH